MSDNYLKISYTAFCRSVYIFCNGNNDKVDRHLPDGENNKIWKRKGCEKMGRKRKTGGGRKPSKPDYEPSTILRNQIEQAVALYSTEEHPALQTIAYELDLNPIKVRKLLITAGMYKYDVANQVQRVFNHYRDAGLSHT